MAGARGLVNKKRLAALHDILEYFPDTGEIYWKVRPRKYFKTVRDCMAWNARFAGKRALASLHSAGYLHGRVFDCTLYAHRVAWAIYHGSWPENEIDHINGNPSDNRIKNLRDVPPSINCQNMPIKSNNTSGHLGVHWSKLEEKWKSFINIKGKRINLGTYSSLEHAIEARRAAEVEHGFHENHGRNLVKWPTKKG